jgi:hypothetical protein
MAAVGDRYTSIDDRLECPIPLQHILFRPKVALDINPASTARRSPRLSEIHLALRNTRRIDLTISRDETPDLDIQLRAPAASVTAIREPRHQPCRTCCSWTLGPCISSSVYRFIVPIFTKV